MIGKFLTVEGPDGSGKSTIIEALSKRLQEEGIDLLITREPGGVDNPIAEAIRHVILHVDHEEMSPKTEALLFAASRAQHIDQTIVPALKQGKLVISDRFLDSSLVYQGVARNLTIPAVQQINDFAINGVMPTLTLLIDVPAEVGLERIYQSTGERQFDRLDRETLEFHQTVRQAFLSLADQYPERIVKIDGTQSVEQVVDECYEVLVQRKFIEL